LWVCLRAQEEIGSADEKTPGRVADAAERDAQITKLMVRTHGTLQHRPWRMLQKHDWPLAALGARVTDQRSSFSPTAVTSLRRHNQTRSCDERQ
jgi:hypothetical protein